MSLYEEGENLLGEGRYEAALDKFMKGIEEFPDSGVIRRCAGIALFRMGRFEEAEAQLRRALELLPEDYIGNVYLTASLTIAGCYGEALKRLAWMKEYYELDLQLGRVEFDYREKLLGPVLCKNSGAVAPEGLTDTCGRLASPES